MVNIGTGFGFNIQDENECDDPKPEFVAHQTFDEIFVNVEGLTNDEDDELQDARDKVIASWSTKKRTNMDGGLKGYKYL